MTIMSQFRELLVHAWPLENWNEDKVVVAVSGGADSTALLDALVSLRPDPAMTVVAHFNHGLRGSDSNDDQHFVEDMASRFELQCECHVASPTERENRAENQLRNLRRRFLIATAAKVGAKWIVLAHHADDQVETFLHNLLRGSGPRGLSGMRPSSSVNSAIRMMRPMLQISRQQILTYLEERMLPYRTDASNAVCNYTRNRIRHELLPILRSFSGSEAVDQRLFQACDLIAQQHKEIEIQARSWLDAQQSALRSSTGLDDRFEIPVELLHGLGWPVLQEVFTIIWHDLNWPLRAMSYKHWKRLEQVVFSSKSSSHPFKQQLPGGIVASYRQGVFRLVRRTT